MICPVRALPASARTTDAEVPDTSGNSIPVSDLRWSPAMGSTMEDSGQVRRVEGGASRGRGRPSVVVQYAPQIAEWLNEKAELSSPHNLRHCRLAAYQRGQSAADQ